MSFGKQITIKIGESAPSLVGLQLVETGAAGPADILVANAYHGEVTVLRGGSKHVLFLPARTATGRGVSPATAAVEDLDLDRNADVVTANAGTRDLAVLLGSDRGFVGSANFPQVGEFSPAAAVVADIDADGTPDVVTADTESKNVSALLGNGDGSFQEPLPPRGAINPEVALTDLHVHPRQLAVGDLSGDGLPDIVTANTQENSVTILVATDSGPLRVRVRYPLNGGESPEQVAVGDVNGDGRLDILTVNSLSEDLSLLLGEGDGWFSPAVAIELPGANTPASIALGDVNQDDKLDVVVGNRLGGSLLIGLGDGEGAFSALEEIELGGITRVSSIGITDRDRDGLEDILASGPGVALVLRGRGDGSFGQPTSVLFRDDAKLSDIVSADIDGDGNTDLVMVDAHHDRVLTAFSTGNRFETAERYSVRRKVDSVVADLNRDGKPDVVANGPAGLTVLVGKGGGHFEPPSSIELDARPTALVAADVGGDESIDLVVTQRESDRIFVLAGQGDGTFASPQQLVVAAGSAPTHVASGDVDRDGHVDLAVVLEGEQSVVVWHGGDLGLTRNTNRLELSEDETTTRLELHDLNQDSSLDVVVADHAGRIVVYLGAGDGTFAADPFVAATPGSKEFDLADVDGDGVLDILSASLSGRSLALLFGVGDGTFLPAVHLPNTVFSDTTPARVVLADMNRDGLVDIVAEAASGDVWFQVSDGDRTFRPPQRIVLDLWPSGRISELEISDLDGDGNNDILLLHPDRGMTAVLARDDDDGVEFSDDGVLRAGNVAAIAVGLTNGDPSSNRLDGWIDFNRDGDWNDPGEQIFDDFHLGNQDGIYHLEFAVPDHVDYGPTFARFRLSTAGNLDPIGLAADGEVEDYRVRLSQAQPIDLGDAPRSIQSGLRQDYPTTIKHDGARHVLRGPRLGELADAETDGRPDVQAAGDDDAGLGDEDGLLLLTSIVSNANGETSATARITVSQSARLDGWIDFNRDGDWFDAGEQVFENVEVEAGENVLSFRIPRETRRGMTVFRLRVSSTGSLSPQGAAADGEVEDHLVEVLSGGSATVLDARGAEGQVQVLLVGESLMVRDSRRELFHDHRVAAVHVSSDQRIHVNGNSWILARPHFRGGRFHRVATNDDFLVMLDGPFDWHNPVMHLDVNANGSIEPLDVLRIVNALNSRDYSAPDGRLHNPHSTMVHQYFDTNSDGFLTPGDAITIINALNRGTELEGQAGVTAPVWAGWFKPSSPRNETHKATPAEFPVSLSPFSVPPRPSRYDTTGRWEK